MHIGIFDNPPVPLAISLATLGLPLREFVAYHSAGARSVDTLRDI